MAGTTPRLGLWYPDGTDPISAGDDGIRSLTTTLDSKVFDRTPGVETDLNLGNSGTGAKIRVPLPHQLEIWDTAGATPQTVTHGNASYANQSMTLGQNTLFASVELPRNSDEVLNAIRTIVPKVDGFTQSDVESLELELIKNPDDTVVSYRDEGIIAILWAAVKILVQERDAALAAAE